MDNVDICDFISFMDFMDSVDFCCLVYDFFGRGLDMDMGIGMGLFDFLDIGFFSYIDLLLTGSYSVNCVLYDRDSFLEINQEQELLQQQSMYSQGQSLITILLYNKYVIQLT